MPTSGFTGPGDEFLDVTTRRWFNVPDEAIGQPIGGMVIRRPVRESNPTEALAEAMEAVKGIERLVAEIGVKFAMIRTGAEEVRNAME